MENSICIGSGIDLYGIGLKLIDIISLEKIDFVSFDCIEKKEEKARYYICIKSKNKIPRKEVASCVTQWILQFYEKKLVANTLSRMLEKKDSTDFYEILQIALGKIRLFDFYSKRLLMIYLINYLNSEDTLLMDGFLTFRAPGYIQIIEDIVLDSIFEFYT